MDFYIIQHKYIDEDGHFDTKMIGIYSSEENAQKAIEKLIQMPGFKKYPTGFIIKKYTVDEDHFIEGFDINKDVI